MSTKVVTIRLFDKEVASGKTVPGEHSGMFVCAYPLSEGVMTKFLSDAWKEKKAVEVTFEKIIELDSTGERL